MTPRRRRLAGRAPAQARRPSRCAFERFLRDEWEKDTPRARELRRLHDVRTPAGSTITRSFACGTNSSARAGRLAVGARAIAIRGPSIACAGSRRDALLRVKWTQWQLDRQWRDGAARGGGRGRRAHGRSALRRGRRLVRRVGAPRASSGTDLHVGTPPEPGAPEGQDWGLPVYDWAALARDRFSWIRGAPMRSGALFSLYRIDHVMGFYRTYFRSVDGRETGFTAAGRARAAPARRDADAAHGPVGGGRRRGPRRRADVPAAVAREAGHARLSRPALGEGRRRRTETRASWPESSVATNGTHDTETTASWFEGLDRARSASGCARCRASASSAPTGTFDERRATLLLRVVYGAPSTLALVMFQDALGTRERINVPGDARRRRTGPTGSRGAWRSCWPTARRRSASRASRARPAEAS